MLNTNDGTLRQRKQATSIARPDPPTWKETVLDQAEDVAGQLFSVASGCLMLPTLISMCFLAMMAYAALVGSDGHQLYELEPTHLDEPINIWRFPFDDDHVALVLYNASSRDHRAFVRRAERVNQQHEVHIVTLDCEAYPVCTNEMLHLQPEYLSALPDTIDVSVDPEVILYYKHRATDAYHHSLRTPDDSDVTPIDDRVREMLNWLDVAVKRAEERSHDVFYDTTSARMARAMGTSRI